MKLKLTILILALIIAFSFIQSKSVNQIVIQATKKINYETDVKPIIKANCLSCHAGKRPRAKLDLSNATNLKEAIENKRLLARINNPKKPMPKEGLMPKSERLIILKWVENNYLKTGEALNKN